MNFPSASWRRKLPPICVRIFSAVRRPILLLSTWPESARMVLQMPDVQRPVLGQGRDGHGLRRVGIFADVGKEIVEHPLEIRHIHAHPAERVGHDHPRGKTRALQLRLRLAEQLLQQDVSVIRLQPHRQLIVRKQEAVSEQLIRQLLDVPRALLAGSEIARRVGRQIALRGDDVEIAEQGRERIADVVRGGR